VDFCLAGLWIFALRVCGFLPCGSVDFCLASLVGFRLAGLRGFRLANPVGG